MDSRDSTDRLITRRTALRAGIGAVAAGIGTRTVTAQSGLDQWFSGQTGGETQNYDGVVDQTGNDTVTVEVGAQGNGGPYAFAPAAVRVDPGTTVKFTWVSDTHNIMIEDQPSGAGWSGHEPIENTGFEYEHTFETEGTYKYYCQPHLALGMKGAIVVGGGGGGGGSGGGGGGSGGGGGGGAVGEPDYGGWFTGQTGGETTSYESTVDQRGNDTVTVEVGAQGNGGPYAFAPTAVRVDPGTTVKFTWVSDTHNIMIEDQPSGAGWSGHEPIENTGFEYEHTFETEGIYKYYCQPHLALGMKGAVVVGDVGGEPAGTGTPAGGEPPAPTGPSLAVQIIGAGIGGVLLALVGVAAYIFANYESYTTTGAGAARRAAGLAPGEVREESAIEQSIVREIGHHDFDPSGTATLIVAYFIILVLMWVFMYFVEFLGGGPTVIG